MRTFNIIFLILSISFSSFGQNNETSINQKFAQLFDSHFSKSEPGGSIMIMKGDSLIFLGNYGLANLETKEKITANTVFNTGSISKTFVANGILILEERGQLSLDDNLQVYFPDFIDSTISQRVTIKHLLSHTSGLPDLRNVGSNPDFFLTAKDEENWAPIKKAKSFNFEPGERFQYSNPAYNGLALIIEMVSGQKWQSFVEKEIFAPSNMPTSKITDGPEPNTGVAHAYVKRNGKYWESDYGEVPTFAAAGNGGIWSSVIELVNYERSIKANKFLSQEMVTKSRSPFTPKNWKGSQVPYIGYSWFLGEEQLIGTQELGVEIVSHTGSQGGFRAFYISIPEKEVMYVALFNRPMSQMHTFMQKGLSIMQESNWFD